MEWFTWVKEFVFTLLDMVTYACNHIHVCASTCLHGHADLASNFFSLQVDGEPYWYYEYLVRKSPTNLVSVFFLNNKS